MASAEVLTPSDTTAMEYETETEDMDIDAGADVEEEVKPNNEYISLLLLESHLDII